MIIFGYITHGIIGFFAALFAIKLCGVTEYEIAMQMTLLGIAGSLLPDIDHPKSFLGRVNPLVFLFKHRGKTHSIIGTLFFAIPFIVIGFPFFMAMWAGALSHCLSDGVIKWI